MVTIVVADACPVFVHGVAHALEQRGFRVVARCYDGRAALAAIREHEPDLALLDLHLLICDSHAVLDEAKSLTSPTAMIVSVAPSLAPRLHDVRDLDTRAYISKGTQVDELRTILRKVASGEVCVSPELRSEVEREVLQTGRRDLSPRERDVVKLVATGLTDKQIGSALFISRETVRTLLGRCAEKLGVSGRAAIVAAAMRLKLID